MAFGKKKKEDKTEKQIDDNYSTGITKKTDEVGQKESFFSRNKKLITLASVVFVVWVIALVLFLFVFKEDEPVSRPPEELPPVEVLPPDDTPDPEEPEDLGLSEIVERYNEEILEMYEGDEVLFVAKLVGEDNGNQDYRFSTMLTDETEGESTLEHLASVDVDLKDGEIMATGVRHLGVNRTVYDPSDGYIYFRTNVYTGTEENEGIGPGRCDDEDFWDHNLCRSTLHRIHILDEGSEYETVFDDQDTFGLMHVRTEGGIELIAYRTTYSEDHEERTFSLHKIDMVEGVEPDPFWEKRVTDDMNVVTPTASLVTGTGGMVYFPYTTKVNSGIDEVVVESINILTDKTTTAQFTLNAQSTAQELRVSPNGRYVSIMTYDDNPNNIADPFYIIDMVDRKAVVNGDVVPIGNISMAWSGENQSILGLNSNPRKLYNGEDGTSGVFVPDLATNDFLTRFGPAYPSNWLGVTGIKSVSDSIMYLVSTDSVSVNQLPAEYDSENRIFEFDWYILE